MKSKFLYLENFEMKKMNVLLLKHYQVEDHTRSARSAIALSHYLAEYILDMVECGKVCF